MELHIETRGKLKPNPEIDSIKSIFFYINNNVPDTKEYLAQSILGVIMICNSDENDNENSMDENKNINKNKKNYIKNESSASSSSDQRKLTTLLKDYGESIDIYYVKTELQLIEKLIEIVHKWDPDILCGFEIEMSSWGYLIQRGYAIELNLLPLLSRIPKHQKFDQVLKEIKEINGGSGGDGSQDNADYYVEMESHIKLTGRILLDVWRLLRYEIALTSYTFENVMYHILHRRYPLHTHQYLTYLWKQQHKTMWIVLEYYLDRVKGTIELLNQLDLIGRTCELAKLFGIQFYEVFSRGSQYRVESMMLRYCLMILFIIFLLFFFFFPNSDKHRLDLFNFFDYT